MFSKKYCKQWLWKIGFYENIILTTFQVQTFGFQVYGGVYDMYKQAGAGALELDYVHLY